jgi:hypothetical protein
MAAADGGVEAGGHPARRWDVALSFAAEQRHYVEQVAQALLAQGIRCFYDADQQVELWGKNLAEELTSIYGEQAVVVVVFISAQYKVRDWTRLEGKVMFSRAVKERREYVLPARFDDTEIPGLLSDLVTIDLQDMTPQAFATLIKYKLATLGVIEPAGRRLAEDPAPGVETPRAPEEVRDQVGQAPGVPAVYQPGGRAAPPDHGTHSLTVDLDGLGIEQIRALREGITALCHLTSCLADLGQTPRLSNDYVELYAQAMSAADLARDRIHLLAQQVGGRAWPHRDKEWSFRLRDAESNFRQNSGVGYHPHSKRLSESAAYLLRVIKGQYPSLFTH